MPEIVNVKNEQEAHLAMQQIVAETMRRSGKVSFAPMLRNTLLPQLRQWHAGYFAADVSPAGVKWPELSPVTVKRKGHANILLETMALLFSLIGQNEHSIVRIQEKNNKATLEYGTRRPEAWKHQDGFPPGKIPKREFLGINRKKLSQVVAMVADEAVKQIKEAPAAMRRAS